MRDRNVDPPASPRFLADVVSDSLASATEGTDYAEAPPFSDEPGSHYVRRLANELAARGVVFHGGTHQPGEAHDYALTCKTCGQPGTIRVSIDPATVPESLDEKVRREFG